PARAVERLRAEAAKARVDRTKEPIEMIAVSVGFSNAERMRRAFLRRFGKSPQASRRDQVEPSPLALIRKDGQISAPDQASKVHRFVATRSADIDHCVAPRAHDGGFLRGSKARAASRM